MADYGIEKPPYGVKPDQFWIDSTKCRLMYIFTGLGNTVTDLSGFGNTGTLTNVVPSSTSGRQSDNTVILDGVDDYIVCGNKSSLVGNSDAITIECWFKLAKTVSEKAYLLGKSSGECVVYFNYNNTPIFRIAGTDPVQLSFGVTLSINTLYQLVVTYNSSGGGNNRRCYINGVPISADTATGSLPTGTQAFIVGAYSTTLYFCNSVYDCVRVYNKSLSSADVWKLYTQKYYMFPKGRNNLVFPVGIRTSA